MGIFDRFKKEERKPEKTVKKEKVEKTEKKVEKKVEKKGKASVLNTKAYRILRKPLITEKGTYLEAENKYVFAVNRNVTKTEIGKAIEDTYGVNVLGVNVVNVPGKRRRYGKTYGKTSSWKKAIITVAQGQAIKIHEGV